MTSYTRADCQEVRSFLSQTKGVVHFSSELYIYSFIKILIRCVFEILIS